MKIHFAWIDPSESYDGARHNREDEKIFRLELNHTEAAFARAQIQIQNPKYGLLWPQDKQHCFISFDGKPVFRGRLLSLPRDIQGELCTLEFVAMPEDVQEQRERLVENIMQEGIYDPLFLPDKPELRELLQAYPALPYWDRLEGRLSLSELFRGKKHKDMGSRFFRDSLGVRMLCEPLTQVEVQLQAEWLQQAQGVFELTQHIKKACSGGYLSSLTGESLERTWWTADSRLPKNGYRVEEGQLRRLKPKDKTSMPESSLPFWQWDQNPKQVRFPRHWYDMCLRMGWGYRQKRRETTRCILSQNVQGTSAHRTKTLCFKLAAILGRNQHWQPDHQYSKDFKVLYEGRVYQCLKRHQSGSIFSSKKWRLLENHVHVDGQAGRATFFPLERGQKAIAYALEVAKSHLAASARAIQIDFSAPLKDVEDITLDHTMSLQDSRLPGGEAKGKVMSYRFVVDGKTGERIAYVRLGVSLGTGIQVIDEMTQGEFYSEPDVWEESVSCGEDSQQRSATGIAFQIDVHAPPMGIQRPTLFSEQDLIEELEIVNDADQQNRILAQRQYPHSLDLKSILKEMPTSVRLKLKNLKTYGCLEHHVPVKVLTRWAAPKQIDLAAPKKE